ncbi:MAG TPA: hypothetical protein VEN78_15005, partial [Bradyrhizobium sp.]|nr:hypothetical protein [Bradyrhizobium sp.]
MLEKGNQPIQSFAHAGAASSAKTAGFGVPSFVPKWRAQGDSNSCSRLVVKYWAAIFLFDLYRSLDPLAERSRGGCGFSGCSVESRRPLGFSNIRLEKSPARLQLLPLKKLLVKCGVALRKAIGGALARGSVYFYSLRETWRFLRACLCRLAGSGIKPCLRRLEPGPTRQLGSEANLTPFRVARRLLEFADLGKECVHEPLNPP